MSRDHTGNLLNSITFEEHDGDLNAKKVSLVSSATIYAVVDIAVGDQIAINSNVTLNPSPNYIGLVSVAQPISTTFSGNVTLDAGSKTQIAGNVTLSDSKTFIGLTTSTAIQGTDPWNVTVKGNVTLSDPKTFIGLVTVGNTPNVAVVGNVTLSDPKTYIGLVTTTIASIPTISTQPLPYSFYQQASLVSGYNYYGLAAPGSNPTQSVWKIQRESLNFGDVLFGGAAATFVHQWSAASLASLTYS